MSSNEDTKKSELSPFENKLIERLKRANERLQGVDDIEQLRPELTIRRVKLKLKPREVSGEDIKQARRNFGVSQAVFAMFLQVNRRSLQEWEQGRTKAPGCVARLISEILADQDYWLKRFKETMELESESS
jgi:putative transcriptional regulator